MSLRSVNLLKIAAEAELLRWQSFVKRQGVRGALGLVAGIFTLGILVMAEAAGWQVLDWRFGEMPASLMMLGVNLVLALVFGLLAMRSSPNRSEREALRIRQDAQREIRASLVISTLIPAASALLRYRRRGKR